MTEEGPGMGLREGQVGEQREMDEEFGEEDCAEAMGRLFLLPPLASPPGLTSGASLSVASGRDSASALRPLLPALLPISATGLVSFQNSLLLQPFSLPLLPLPGTALV